VQQARQRRDGRHLVLEPIIEVDLNRPGLVKAPPDQAEGVKAPAQGLASMSGEEILGRNKLLRRKRGRGILLRSEGLASKDPGYAVSDSGLR
jgi:hypothetical protein